MSSSKDKKKKPHGQIRQSQVVMTFGPGSMFDLPNQAVIVGGLEYWTKGDEIHEPRLLAKLKDLLQLSSLVLHAPPPADDDPGSTRKTGIDSIQFPEWFITQSGQGQETGSPTRSRRLVHRTSLTGTSKFIDEEKESQPVVPIRFVRACKKGHIGDIDWYAFAHGGANDLPSSPLDRRTRDQRRSLRGLGPVRVRPGRAPDHRRDQAADEHPRALRWFSALARSVHEGAVR